jgi:hypothetical protein
MPSYLRPTSASKFRSQPRRDPISNQTLDVTLCARHAHCGAGGPPLAPLSPGSRLLPVGLRSKNIVSPVAQYIHASPRQRQMMSPSPRTPDSCAHCLH